MKGIAEFEIIGQVVRVKEVGQKTVVDIASDYPKKRQDGTWDTRTHFNSVSVFKKTAERAHTAKPGDTVRVTGRLRNSKFDGKDGTQYIVEVVGEAFDFLAKGKRSAGEEE